MRRELEEGLRKSYPLYFRDMYGHPTQTCMAFGLKCGDGWYEIIERLCGRLVAAQVGDFQFDQIKEKFGTLRVYFSCPDSEEAIKLVDEAEAASWFVCEECGGVDGVTMEGAVWIRTLCPICRSAR